MKLYCWKHHHFSHAPRIHVKPNSGSWWWWWWWSIAKKKMEERFGVCPAEPWKKRGFGKRFGRDLGCFFEEFLHIVFSKMAMSTIIDFLNHRHWLCLAHSHHSHLHSLAKLPFVLLNMKAKQSQGFADSACKLVVKIMLKRHTKNKLRRLWVKSRSRGSSRVKKKNKKTKGMYLEETCEAGRWAWSQACCTRCMTLRKATSAAALSATLLAMTFTHYCSSSNSSFSPNRVQFRISPLPHCTASSLKRPSLKLLQVLMMTTLQSV